MREVHLVETSELMKSLQAERLQPVASKRSWQIHWHNSLDDLPIDKNMFTFVVAHEFFDALPFHLLQVLSLSLPAQGRHTEFY